MRRRRLLRYGGMAIVGTTGLAGCGAPGPGAQEETPGETDGTPIEDTTPAESPAATPDETQTETSPTTTTTNAGTDGGENTVAMVTEGENFLFDPIGLLVQPGETVTWRNESGSHSSTAYVQGNGQAEVTRIPEDAQGWDSGILTEEGATFEQQFDVAGTYDYFCTPHKQLEMVGRLVVGEPGGPAEGSQPPDGEVPEGGAIVEQGAIGWDEFTG